MSRIYNFMFGDIVEQISCDVITREIFEDEFLLYYNFFQFLLENKNAVREGELKSLGMALSRAKVKTESPVITEAINEIKENYSQSKK